MIQPRGLRPVSVAAQAACIAMLSGCASQQGSRAEAANPDPFEPVNRVMYKVNDFGDRYLAKPVAKGYEKGTPGALRVGVSHFLDNLRYPITIINDLLQGKVRQSGADLARLTLNSTVGLFGLFDPATDIGLKANDEDFGQTLAVWGVPQGPYLVIPVFGPYTVTSAFGALVDTQVSPLAQAPQGGDVWVAWGGYLIDTRYRYLGVDEEVQRAYDPYIFVRDAYLQNRNFKIYDGNVPEEEIVPEDDPPEPAP